MAKDKDLIQALKEELKSYELYGKAKRAKEVKDAIKKAGGSVETKTAKPKAEKKVEKKKQIMPGKHYGKKKMKGGKGKGRKKGR